MSRVSPASPVRRGPTAAAEEPPEDEAFLSRQIITYLGNKRALLPLLGEAVGRVQQRLGRKKLRTLDLFSGSGIVARWLKQHSSHLIANDLEAYSRVCNQCHLRNRSTVDRRRVARQLASLRRRIARERAPGFLTELYAPRQEKRITSADRCFYTRENATFLDTAARILGELDEGERPLFLAPLLAAASVHANTAGVFKGFYKDASGRGQFGGRGRHALSRILGRITLEAPVLSRFDCDTEVFQEDANTLVGRLPEVDLAYLDPPYNQHPYGSNYFMLNLLVDYRRPEMVSRVSGIPTDWNRSRYNRRPEAEDALFSLIDAIRARFILLSYNSEGFIPPARFPARLRRRGRLTELAASHPVFRGSRNLHARPRHVTEHLYLLEKR